MFGSSFGDKLTMVSLLYSNKSLKIGWYLVIVEIIKSLITKKKGEYILHKKLYYRAKLSQNRWDNNVLQFLF